MNHTVFPNRLVVTARPGSPFPVVELVRDLPVPLQPCDDTHATEISKELADA